jgi:hypothetical protein
MTTNQFYYGVTEDGHINSQKNGWFGHKSQNVWVEMDRIHGSVYYIDILKHYKQ